MILQILMMLLLASQSVHAMKQEHKAIVTNQAINNRLTEVVRGSFGNDVETFSSLQVIFRDLDMRQKAWKYGVQDSELCYVIQADDVPLFVGKPHYTHDVFLWQTLSDVVSNLHDQLERDVEAKEDAFTPNMKILLDKCSLLYALVSKGLSIELLRSVEFSGDHSVGVQAEEVQKTFGKPSDYLGKVAREDNDHRVKIDIAFYECLVLEHREAVKAHVLKQNAKLFE